MTDAIAPFAFSTLPGEESPWHEAPVTSTKQVRYLVDRIYDACFVVIAYLVGARVSEILGLQVGCIEQHPASDGGETFAYLAGQIYKTARGVDGEAHRWVAPAPVERAILVMERLTARLRAQSGRSELFLVMASTGLVGPAARINLPIVSTIIRRLNDLFAPFIGLPDHEGEPWHLNTHQGRKTFARFVGKRDRTGLHALQAHFGHVTRAMTDRGYVGTDFALDDLIDRHTQEETRAALEEVLTATALAGGRMIAARSQFRGRTRDGDVQAYVGFLMEETDLRLGVCDWGYCVYRVETAACFGDERGPNPVLRTESTCVSPAPTLPSRPGIDRSGRRGAIAMPIFSITPGWTRPAAGLRKHGSPNAIASLANSIMERVVAMARKLSKTPALTPHEKRLRNTDRKLREALERLVKGLPTHPDLQKRSYRLTVATLAREARVGRNAIYTNHRSMIVSAHFHAR